MSVAKNSKTQDMAADASELVSLPPIHPIPNSLFQNLTMMGRERGCPQPRVLGRSSKLLAVQLTSRCLTPTVATLCDLHLACLSDIHSLHPLAHNCFLKWASAHHIVLSIPHLCYSFAFCWNTWFSLFLLSTVAKFYSQSTRRLIKFNLRPPHLHHPFCGPWGIIIISSHGHVLCKVCRSKISRLRLLSFSNPTLPWYALLFSHGVEVALSILGIWWREN